MPEERSKIIGNGVQILNSSGSEQSRKERWPAGPPAGRERVSDSLLGSLGKRSQAIHFLLVDFDLAFLLQ